MLNLMPPEAKSDIRYARRNAFLAKWVAAIVTVVLLMGATVLLGGIYIDSSKDTLTASTKKTEDEMAAQNLSQVKKDAEALSQGVKLIVQVLSKEVQFSKLLQQIGSLMPKDTVLGNIQLSNKVVGAIDLTAEAIDYKSATQVQLNLQDPKNKLFQKVDTVNVSCDDSTATTAVVSRYKCQITMRAEFSKEAAVTYLGETSATKPAAKPGAKP